MAKGAILVVALLALAAGQVRGVRNSRRGPGWPTGSPTGSTTWHLGPLIALITLAIVY